MTKLKIFSELEKDLIKNSKKIGKFEREISLPIPFLPELLVKSLVKLKGLYLGAKYAVINTKGFSSDDCDYSLSGIYTK